jgi:hypothetical protein
MKALGRDEEGLSLADKRLKALEGCKVIGWCESRQLPLHKR